MQVLPTADPLWSGYGGRSRKMRQFNSQWVNPTVLSLSMTTTPPDQQEPKTTPEITGYFGAVVMSTFTTIFLAELGDKTQLATLLLSAESGRPLWVFIGAALALVGSSLVGVLIGRWLATVLPPERLERMAGVLMVGLGLWLGIQALGGLLHAPT